MTWQVGDKAVCVDASASSLLLKGEIYTVAGIFPHAGLDLRGVRGAFGLLFLEITPTPGCAAFSESRFRKIVSDKHEPCEAEFVTLLNRAKRPVSA
jgi:hypothetical protein